MRAPHAGLRQRPLRRCEARKIPRYVVPRLIAEEVLSLLKLEPNATCGFVRATFMSKLVCRGRRVARAIQVR
jgi:hypothetical protein